MLNVKELDSGIVLYHFDMPNAAICKVMIGTNCGSSHETADSWGVAHFLEHLCFQGTALKNKHQVSREQALVGSYNAYTNYFETVYHFDSLNEDFERGLTLLKEAVFDSNFPEAEFEKEKSVIVEEWRMYDNQPSEGFWNFITDKCFGKNEGHPIIGTEQSIMEMNPEKLHRFRNKWYGKENMFVVVVGNLKFDRVVSAFNSILPSINSVEKTNLCLGSLECDTDKYTYQTDRFEQAAYGLVLKDLSQKEKFEKSCAPHFFDYALNKYLYEYIRDDLGLCYGVSIGNFEHFENSYSIISLLTNNRYLPKVELEMKNIFEKIKNEGFPQELFEICKKQLLYNNVKKLQTVQGVAGTIVGWITTTSDQDWFIENGPKMLDVQVVKEFADKLTPKALQEIAIQKLDNMVRFEMVSTKVEF